MVLKVVVYYFYLNIVLSKDKNSKLWSTMHRKVDGSNCAFNLNEGTVRRLLKQSSFKLNKNCMLFLSEPKSKQNHLKIQRGEWERDSVYSVLVTTATEKIEPPLFPPLTTPLPFINCPHRNSLKGYNLYSGRWGAEDFTLLYVVLEKAPF